MINLSHVILFWTTCHMFAWVSLLLRFGFGIEEAEDFDIWFDWGAKFLWFRLFGALVKVFFEPRDIWIGVYWKRYPKALDLYIVFAPCLPINIYYQWN